MRVLEKLRVLLEKLERETHAEWREKERRDAASEQVGFFGRCAPFLSTETHAEWREKERR